MPCETYMLPEKDKYALDEINDWVGNMYCRTLKRKIRTQLTICEHKKKKSELSMLSCVISQSKLKKKTSFIQCLFGFLC